MFILYVSNLCSERVFKIIFDNSVIKPGQQVQKFHRLLVEGITKFTDSISVLSRVPTNKSTSKSVEIPSSERVSNIRFFYLKPPEIGIIREFYLLTNSFVVSLRQLLKNKTSKKVVMIDVLNLSTGIGAFLAAKVLRVKTVAIVTDIPSYMNYSKANGNLFSKIKKSLYNFLTENYLRKFDSYILLTRFMNKVVNKKNKPYIVVEGFSDSKLKNTPNEIQNKSHKKIILYAGALHEKFGIKKLLEAFMKLENEEVELWLLGSGDMEREILSYQNRDSRIKFFGTVENQRVLELERIATLLVNPRPSDEEFSKYSFPSKLIEYMSSGTPVLTTKLPGIPEEYFEHLYFFDDESIDGLKKSIEKILSLPLEELHKKGKNAKEFILRKKNNISQSRKILDFILKNIFEVKSK